MKNGEQRKWVLIIGLFIAIVFINAPVAYTYFYHELTGAPEAVSGRIDLSTVNLASEKVYLDGQWQFYWKSLIKSEPDKHIQKGITIGVPDSWSGCKINDRHLPAGGYGSYRLTMSELEYDKAVTLYIPDFAGAYRVFIDGQITSESGNVSKNISEIFTVPKAELYPLKLSAGETHEVVIEVATTRFSGLYMTPILTDYDKTVSNNSNMLVFQYIMFGVALFSFLSLAGMYSITALKKLNSFWLPGMLLFIVVRIMLTSEFYSFWQTKIFFNLSYEATNELMYFTTFVIKYLVLFLVQEQCGISFSKREKIGFLMYYILLYSIYFFTPQNFYNSYLSVFLPMLTYVLDFYLFSKMYRGWQKIKKFGMIVFWDIILLISGLTIDSYYINGKIYLNFSLVLLLLLMIFSLIISVVYALRIGNLYDDFSESSSRLELAKSQIAMQKEYYESLSGQMDEIREAKHDMRHFMGVLGSLSEEGRYYDLKVFLQEYREKIQMQQLPVFCENVVVNSIIGYYYLRAKSDGITFRCRCNIGKHSVISDSDFCVILGNALENAVCACRQMDKDKIRFVYIEVATIKKQWLIKISNSYNGILKMSEGRFISSKEGKFHGMGIRNLEKVVESYGGFVKIERDEKEFILMAALPEM